MSEARIAPKDCFWVCMACGKYHQDYYGIQGEGSLGWEASCMLNSCLFHQKNLEFDKKGKRILKVLGDPIALDKNEEKINLGWGKEDFWIKKPPVREYTIELDITSVEKGVPREIDEN